MLLAIAHNGVRSPVLWLASAGVIVLLLACTAGWYRQVSVKVAG
jgi:hypothetical protein